MSKPRVEVDRQFGIKDPEEGGEDADGDRQEHGHRDHRALRSGVMSFARAAPPFLPSALAAGSLPSSGIRVLAVIRNNVFDLARSKQQYA